VYNLRDKCLDLLKKCMYFLVVLTWDVEQTECTRLVATTAVIGPIRVMPILANFHLEVACRDQSGPTLGTLQPY
jgi:hypothetical protein